ncbi:MAG: hypothetical protein RR440_00440 [Erysipelotrichaceae bacterium]
MDYLKIINYRGFEVSVKRPANKKRSDKKHTVKALLSAREKQIVNAIMYEQGYDYVVDFVTDAIANGIQLAITQGDINAAKRPLREADGIQVNGRVHAELYDKFRMLQAKANLNQRQLTLVLLKKAVEMAGYRWK